MAYTFKDDGSALTYYREYNKEVGTGDKTLVGNWVEERALRDTIKTGRYHLWANPDPDPKAPQQTFTKFTTRPDSLDTYNRTLVHSDHTPPAEFATSNMPTDPGYAVYVNPQKGVRTALLEKRAMELAQSSAPVEEALPPQFFSTTQCDFVPKDLPAPAEMGRRVMMTQNMEDIKGAGDAVWRASNALISPALVANAPEPAETLRSGFGKDTSFSVPISEYLKGETKN